MAEAADERQWDHTAPLLALLANAHRDPKRRRPFTERDFHPYRARRPPPPAEKVSMGQALTELGL